MLFTVTPSKVKNWKNKKKIDKIKKACTNQSNDVRFEAIKSLLELEYYDIVRILTSALDDDKNISCFAVKALGKIDDESALGALLEAISNSDEKVRKLTFASLSKKPFFDIIVPYTNEMNSYSYDVNVLAKEFLASKMVATSMPQIIKGLEAHDLNWSVLSVFIKEITNQESG